MGCGASTPKPMPPCTVDATSMKLDEPNTLVEAETEQEQTDYADDFEADEDAPASPQAGGVSLVSTSTPKSPMRGDALEADEEAPASPQASGAPFTSTSAAGSAGTHPVEGACTRSDPSPATLTLAVEGMAADVPAPVAEMRRVQTPWHVLEIDELELGDVLGVGGMGTVHTASWHGQLVAVKQLRDTSVAGLRAIESELFVHATLVHPSIVRLIGANLTPPSCCIALEHCECSLFDRLHRRSEEVERRWVVRIGAEVAEAMEYLHSRSPPIVHRDLKSHNVLLHRDGSVRVCDFGLVDVREVTAGTPNYMAPELLQSRPYSRPVDVYAFGVLLNEAFTRQVPWDGYKPFDIKEMVSAGQRPPTAMTMPVAAERLLQKAWHQAAALRPTFAEIVRELRAVEAALPMGAAALGIGALTDMPDALDALIVK